jgi:hypothetical protein
MQPIVCLMDSQDGQHEYPVRKEVREVSSSANPLLLQPIVYLMDVLDGQHEYPERDEVREVSFSA